MRSLPASHQDPPQIDQQRGHQGSGPAHRVGGPVVERPACRTGQVAIDPEGGEDGQDKDGDPPDVLRLAAQETAEHAPPGPGAALGEGDRRRALGPAVCRPRAARRDRVARDAGGGLDFEGRRVAVATVVTRVTAATSVTRRGTGRTRWRGGRAGVRSAPAIWWDWRFWGRLPSDQRGGCTQVGEPHPRRVLGGGGAPRPQTEPPRPRSTGRPAGRAAGRSDLRRQTSITTGTIMGRRLVRSATKRPRAERARRRKVSKSTEPDEAASSKASSTARRASPRSSSASGAYTHPRVMISGPVSTSPDLARKIAGATVIRGVAGFGADHHMHTDRRVLFTENLPMKIEFVESQEKIDAILPKLYEMVGTGLIEVQDTTIVKSAEPGGKDAAESARDAAPSLKRQSKAKLMRVYVGENDKWRGKPLHTALLESMRANDIAGVTVYRGILGYGANRRIHADNALHLSHDVPILLSVIDTEEKLRAYIPVLDDMLQQGLVVFSDVDIIKYTHDYQGAERRKEQRS